VQEVTVVEAVAPDVVVAEEPVATADGEGHEAQATDAVSEDKA
jgi:hypothetical protein